MSLRILLSKWEKWSYVTLWAGVLHPIDNRHQSLRVSPDLLNHSGSPAVTWPSEAKVIAINRPSVFLFHPPPLGQSYLPGKTGGQGWVHPEKRVTYQGSWVLSHN